MKLVTKEKPPSDAQARRLAQIWGGNLGIQIGETGFCDPTDKVLIREGWLIKNGTTGTWPSGGTYYVHRISQGGIWALATYFINKAHGR